MTHVDRVRCSGVQLFDASDVSKVSSSLTPVNERGMAGAGEWGYLYP